MSIPPSDDDGGHWGVSYDELEGDETAPTDGRQPALAPKRALTVAKGPNLDWRATLRKNDKNRITSDPGNAVVILSNDPDWDSLRYNEFSGHAVVDACPSLGSFAPPRPGAIDTYVEMFVGHWIAKNYQVSFTSEALGRAIDTAAKSRPFNPLQDYLTGLTWDGKNRIDTWLHVYLGAKDTAVNRAIGAMWLISAVARAMVPGEKVDHMLILEGPQGNYKTSALQALASKDWFLPDVPDLRNKDASVLLLGKWIVCLDEMHSLRSVDVTELAKNYLTRQVDVYRPPYAKRPIHQPRTATFCGTTNPKGAYLTDPTGARRFWPVETERIDLQSILRDRDQLWAEAVHDYHDGRAWHPKAEDASLRLGLQDLVSERTEQEDWGPMITEWVARKQSVSIGEVLGGCLSIPPERWGSRESQRVGRFLTNVLKWQRVRFSGGNGRAWRYVNPSQDLKSVPGVSQVDLTWGKADQPE